MSDEVKTYLQHIKKACGLIEEFTSGRTFEEYQQDAFLRSAVERQFEIVGEALNQALKIFPELSEHITDSKRIVSFRNRLIHGYSFVSNHIVWGILESNLDVLKEEVEVLLE